MKIITLLTLSLLSGVSCAQTMTFDANTAAPAPVSVGVVKTESETMLLLNEADLKRLRANKGAFDSILEAATKNLDYQPVPVEILAPGAHYDAKGVNPHANGDKQLSLDCVNAYRSALAYLISEDPRYAATAQRIIDAWAGTLTAVTTHQGKFNVSSNVPYMIIAASWVRGANGWDSSKFDKFLPAVILPASTSEATNNHGFWGLLLESSAYDYLGDKAGLDKAHARWNELMQGAVAVDGAMIEEVERSGTSNWHGGPDKGIKGIKGIAYTHYAVLPASLGAKIFADNGQPVWQTEEGQLLKLAFAKAAAWTLHPETFPYYASNNGKLEGVRSADCFVLLQKHYPNENAKAVLNDGEKIGLGGFVLQKLFGTGETA